MRVAIDTGGTFTDCVYIEGGAIKVLKVFSTPADPPQSVLQALKSIGVQQSLEVRHGTTVGTNTMLERKGARVAFVTTSGFEDTIAIGRQTRNKLYDWFAPVPTCLVPAELRFGLPERVNAEGDILRSPTEEELQSLVNALQSSGAEAVAISLLFSFANDHNERRLERSVTELRIPVSVSHRILPEFREYERASTTVANAYLAPRMQSYLLKLEEEVTSRFAESRVDVMQSSGGIISARVAATEPVRTILSGPAGGVIGASNVAQWAGFDRIIGIDIGGTSTDVFLADTKAGGAHRTKESIVAGVPVSVPMLDIHTIGAGGGSIARFDAGGLLRVGPDSAGAEPGPICFGRGTLPTVTDADLLLGRLDAETFLGGRVQLDLPRTRQLMQARKGSCKTVEEFAAGILRVVETQMEKAIRIISVERGHDPRDFALVAFGGGGPLHACSLASALRIPSVLIPRMPGALSAVGILLADTVRDYSCTVMMAGEEINRLSTRFDELQQLANAEFASEHLRGEAQRTVDLRYRGQGYELNVPFESENPGRSIEAFHQAHQRRYGFSDPEKPLEIVTLRLRMISSAEPYVPTYRTPDRTCANAPSYADKEIYFGEKFLRSRLHRREELLPGMAIRGPAMITEYTSATVLPPDWIANVDGFGNLVLTLEAAA